MPYKLPLPLSLADFLFLPAVLEKRLIAMGQPVAGVEIHQLLEALDGMAGVVPVVIFRQMILQVRYAVHIVENPNFVIPQALDRGKFRHVIRDGTGTGAIVAGAGNDSHVCSPIFRY